MKLKYYLRGLGIGIVVAVIITSVSMGNRQPMTDEEIKERAKELGMIENSVLTDIADKDDDIEKTEELAKDDNIEKTEEPAQDEETVQDEQTDQGEENPDEQQQKEPQYISITVVGGDSSWTVSKRMEEAGLIQSAKDFDTYLCSYGYDKKISVGTYEIPITATHEEMAKILTKMN